MGPFQAAMDPEIVKKSQLAGLPVKLEEIQPSVDTKPLICSDTKTEEPQKTHDVVTHSASKELSNIAAVSVKNKKKRNTGNF